MMLLNGLESKKKRRRTRGDREGEERNDNEQGVRTEGTEK